jgi:hypothetical protein
LRYGVIGHANPYRAALRVLEALRRFVHGFVRERDLSVGFATAGEVIAALQHDLPPNPAGSDPGTGFFGRLTRKLR